MGSMPSVPASAIDDDRHERHASVFGGLIAVGAALLALGLVWGWQTWSNRSGEPIDDLLPMLVADAGDGDSAGVDADDLSVPVVDVSGTPVVADTASAPEDEAEPVGDGEQSADPAEIIVHVSGAVGSPGVVVLPAGSRVFEAVERAGSATHEADLDRVNLAAPVIDGERIHVPAHDEEVVPSLVPSMRPSSLSGSDSALVDPVVDINNASASDLESLPGVGPATAQAIVQTREDRGPYLSVDELLEVPGIGETKLEQMRPFAVVGR